MKSVIPSLAKSVLLPLGLSARISPVDAVIQKKIYGSGTTTLMISNEEMEDIMKIIKSLEDSELLIKEISETIKNEAKEQKEGFLLMLLRTVVASLLALLGKGVITAGEGTIRAGENFNATSSFN